MLESQKSTEKHRIFLAVLSDAGFNRKLLNLSGLTKIQQVQTIFAWFADFC
jgi:hypothetical protein